mmetsp:Transcript_8219/g.24498  ORF Transcript_8219/g.24498 Transcript_8219/m.24498 type:complete len:210 (-) Transcript_8219:428-1057(-)
MHCCIARIPRKGDIDGCTLAITLPGFRVLPGKGEGASLMRGHKENVWLAVEGVMGAVAMVHIKVKDCYPLQSVLLLAVPSRDGNGAEQAEAHGNGRERMMAWWTADAKASCAANAVSSFRSSERSLHNSVDQSNCGASCSKGIVVGSGGNICIGVHERGRVILHQLPQPFYVSLTVYGSDLFQIRRSKVQKAYELVWSGFCSQSGCFKS